MRISDWSSDVCSSDLQRKNALALHTVDHGDALALERHRDDLRFLGWQFERAARTGREVHEPQTRLARALCTVALHNDLGARLQVVSARPGPGSLGIRSPLRHPPGYICGPVAAIVLCVDSPQCVGVIKPQRTVAQR